MKLGKLPVQYDRRTLKLRAYLNLPKLPPLPQADDNYQRLSRLTMAGNDVHSDCVVAGAAHAVQVWSSMASREVVIPDAQVLKTYFGLTGGSDDGLNVLEFLKYWRKNPIAGHPLGAFVALNPANPVQMQYAIHLFGAVFTGIALPLSAQKQKVWDIPQGGPESQPNSWGGHLTICGAYDRSGNYINYTWGEKQPMTPGFSSLYVDEAYALLSLDWFTKKHKSPDGFAWQDLQADLAAVSKR